MFAKDFTGFLNCDCDCASVYEHKDVLSCIFFSNSHVVEFASAAQGEFAGFIDFVVTDPPVIGDGIVYQALP